MLSCRRPPGHDVVGLAGTGAGFAAGEDAATVAQVQGGADVRGHEPPFAANVEHLAGSAEHGGQQAAVAAQPAQVAGADRFVLPDEPGSRRRRAAACRSRGSPLIRGRSPATLGARFPRWWLMIMAIRASARRCCGLRPVASGSRSSSADRRRDSVYASRIAIQASPSTSGRLPLNVTDPLPSRPNTSDRFRWAASAWRCSRLSRFSSAAPARPAARICGADFASRSESMLRPGRAAALRPSPAGRSSSPSSPPSTVWIARAWLDADPSRGRSIRHLGVGGQLLRLVQEAGRLPLRHAALSPSATSSSASRPHASTPAWRRPSPAARRRPRSTGRPGPAPAAHTPAAPRARPGPGRTRRGCPRSRPVPGLRESTQLPWNKSNTHH